MTTSERIGSSEFEYGVQEPQSCSLSTPINDQPQTAYHKERRTNSIIVHSVLAHSRRRFWMARTSRLTWICASSASLHKLSYGPRDSLNVLTTRRDGLITSRSSACFHTAVLLCTYVSLLMLHDLGFFGIKKRIQRHTGLAHRIFHAHDVQ